jgi:hypothetical protein
MNEQGKDFLGKISITAALVTRLVKEHAKIKK